MTPINSAASDQWYAACSKAPGCRYRVQLLNAKAVQLHADRCGQKLALSKSAVVCKHCHKPASLTFGVAATSLGRAKALLIKCDSPACGKLHAIDSTPTVAPRPIVTSPEHATASTSCAVNEPPQASKVAPSPTDAPSSCKGKGTRLPTKTPPPQKSRKRGGGDATNVAKISQRRRGTPRTLLLE